jgi:alcohol dehydrogenase class IV
MHAARLSAARGQLRAFSAQAAPAQAALPFLAVAEAAASLSRTPTLLRAGGVSDVGRFVSQALSCGPGTKCIVLATTSGGARAPILLHFLRKAGLAPLLLELPDAGPLTAHTPHIVATAKRTGSTLVVGFGSAATINLARACAALLMNGGKAEEFMPSAGGKRTLSAVSAPFLAVPTCPGGAELGRNSLLLAEGRTLGVLRAHPASLQACLVDPSLAVSASGESGLALSVSTLAHCIEAYTRGEDEYPDGKGRVLAWEGLRLAAGSLVASQADGASPAGLQGRAAMAVASLAASASMAAGPLGPARGTSLAIASRFSIAYSAALAAVSLEMLPAVAANLLAAAEEQQVEAGGEGAGEAAAVDRKRALEEEEEEDVDELEEGGRGDPQRRGSALPFGRKSGAAFAKRGGKGLVGGGKREREGREEEEEDGKLDHLLEQYAAAAAEEREEEEEGEDRRDEGWEAEDDEMVRAARRWTAAGRLLASAAAAVKGAGPADAVCTIAALPLQPGEGKPPRERLPPLDRAAIEGLDPALRALVAAAAAAAHLPGGSPRLSDFSLSEADFGAIAASAEVADDTLACLVKLRRGDLLEILRAC